MPHPDCEPRRPLIPNPTLNLTSMPGVTPYYLLALSPSMHEPSGRCQGSCPQDVAVALGSTDPLSVPDGVRQLVAVIKAVPRLQSFVSDVCKARTK